jgi:hypothetical protein
MFLRALISSSSEEVFRGLSIRSRDHVGSSNLVTSPGVIPSEARDLDRGEPLPPRPKSLAALGMTRQRNQRGLKPLSSRTSTGLVKLWPFTVSLTK